MITVMHSAGGTAQPEMALINSTLMSTISLLALLDSGSAQVSDHTWEGLLHSVNASTINNSTCK
jgi:hypothetical protein